MNCNLVQKQKGIDTKKDNSTYVNDYDSNSKFDEIIVKGEHKVIILF